MIDIEAIKARLEIARNNPIPTALQLRSAVMSIHDVVYGILVVADQLDNSEPFTRHAKSDIEDLLKIVNTVVGEKDNIQSENIKLRSAINDILFYRKDPIDPFTGNNRFEEALCKAKCLIL